jgi:hypothetical protein
MKVFAELFSKSDSKKGSRKTVPNKKSTIGIVDFLF